MLNRLPLSKSERLVAGSSNDAQVRRTSLIDETSSVGSSSASERTLVAEKCKNLSTNCIYYLWLILLNSTVNYGQNILFRFHYLVMQWVHIVPWVRAERMNDARVHGK